MIRSSAIYLFQISAADNRLHAHFIPGLVSRWWVNCQGDLVDRDPIGIAAPFVRIANRAVAVAVIPCDLIVLRVLVGAKRRPLLRCEHTHPPGGNLVNGVHARVTGLVAKIVMAVIQQVALPDGPQLAIVNIDVGMAALDPINIDQILITVAATRVRWQPGQLHP